MKISVYSITASISTTVLLFSLLYLCRRHFQFKKVWHVQMFSILYLISFMRLLLPTDFSFTKGISIGGLFTDIWDFLFNTRFSFCQWNFSLITFTLLIVLLISIYRSVLFFINSKKTIRKLNYCVFSSKQIERVMGQILEEYPHYKFNCRGVKTLYQHIPFTVGIFNPLVVIPNITFTDKELYFILLHELTHLHKHDLLKKFLLQFYQCIFWWVPFNSAILSDIEQIIEICCDNTLIKNFSDKDKSAYMAVMIKCIENMPHNAQFECTSLGFNSTNNRNSMMERFLVIISKERAPKKLQKALLVLMISCLLITYFFVPMPSHPAPEINCEVTTKNSYLIREGGQFFLVRNGNCKIEICASNVPQFISQGFLIKEDAP